MSPEPVSPGPVPSGLASGGLDTVGLDVAEAVAAATLAVPGVHDLRAGVAGEAATYLPGRRVAGVVVRGDAVAVHVVLEWGATVALTADRVRTAVGGLVAGPVDVVVEDVTDPGTPRPDTALTLP